MQLLYNIIIYTIIVYLLKLIYYVQRTEQNDIVYPNVYKIRRLLSLSVVQNI
jgi:hypothetical protein